MDASSDTPDTLLRYVVYEVSMEKVPRLPTSWLMLMRDSNKHIDTELMGRMYHYGD